MDLGRVHLVQNLQLSETLNPRQHDIHHSWLVSSGNVNNQGTWIRNSLSLKKDLSFNI